MKNRFDQPAQHDSKRSTVVAVVVFMTLAFSAYGAKAFTGGKAEDEVSIRASLVQPEKVALPSEDGDLKGGVSTMLEGYIFRPDGLGPFPAIVGLHGCSGLFTSGRMNARFADWGRRLATLGYIVLFPDSFTPRGIPDSCSQKDRSGFSAYRERRRDANGALHWLQRQSMVQSDRIGLMGWSNGGTTLLATIGTLSRENSSDSFQVAIAFYPGCTSFVKKNNWQPRIPLTIFIGEADDWTPAAPCKALVSRANEQGCRADIVTFPNAYHDFDHPNLLPKIRKGLAFTVNDQGTARVGTDTEGRAAALELVPMILARYLVQPPEN